MEKVIMLFDGACPLCRREVSHYQWLDKGRAVVWVDISQLDKLKERYGVDYQTAMARLHVIDRTGVMQTGARAFVTLWEVLPGY